MKFWFQMGWVKVESKVMIDDDDIRADLRMSCWSGSDDDVVDGNVNEFDEEADESHDGEPYRRGHGDLRELLPVRLRASLDETHRVLGELTHRLQLHDEGVHCDMRIGWSLEEG